MSKRSDFTHSLAILLIYITNEGDVPILDYVKRSEQEQKRLYEAGLSKCDGMRIVSKHQKGEAADLYLLKPDGSLHDWNSDDRWQKYHDFWAESGGAKVILWDKPHFESK